MGRSARSDQTAAHVIGGVLRRLVAALRTAESDIRLDRSRAVGEFRGVCRHLRSVLKATASLVDEPPGVVAGLREASQKAGPAREHEVLQQRLARALAVEPVATAALALGERLDRELEGDRRRHWVRLVDHLDSTPYDDLVRRLDGFADITPWSATASRPAAQVLLPILLDEGRRFDAVADRVRAGGWGTTEAERGLRELGKRAEALRRISDAVHPTLGKPAKGIRKEVGRVEALLGELRDSRLFIDHLVSRREAGELDDDQRSVMDRLLAREVDAFDRARSEFLHAPAFVDRRRSAS